MIRTALLLSLIAALWLAVKADAQDSMQRIIVSNRVGVVINSRDQERFGLFQQFQNFSHAFFYRTSDSAYHCWIQYETPAGIKDSVFNCSEAYLLRLQEWIDHYEDIQSGGYRMGDDPPKSLAIEGENATADSAYRYSIFGSDILPISQNENEIEIEEFPTMSFGVGVSSFSLDLSRLNAAYSAIEDHLASANFPVPHQTPQLNVAPVLWYSLEIRVAHPVSILLEAADHDAGGESFSGVSGSILYSFDLPDTRLMHPYLGLGIGKYHYSETVNYGTPIDSLGNYLDAIKSEGGSIGWLILSGVELRSDHGFGLCLSVNYLAAPMMNTSLPEGISAEVSLSSFIFGARLSYTF